MHKSKLPNLFGITIAILCLMAIPLQTQAANKGKAKAAQLTKEHLVLMPLRVAEEDKSLQGAMESALVKGLQQKYEVFSGEQVAQKAHEIFLKESRSTAKKECDETRCMQGIAEAFQAELIATANVTKREDGYFLALSVQNIFDNKVVYSDSIACKNCDAYQVVDKLKELSGASVPVAAAPTPEAPQPKVNMNDPDAVLWAEAQKGNTAEDYQVYLDIYPKGKYVPFAKARIKKIKDAAQSATEQQEQQAWDTAQQESSETSYGLYLKSYPAGRFAGLARVRSDKLKNDVAAREEQALWQTVQASEDSKIVQGFLDKYPASSHLAGAQQKLAAIKKAEANLPKAGPILRDCPDCPEMVVIPAGNFDMGSNTVDDEKPVHRVSLGKPFAVGKTEVTQGQWKAIMGNNPSNFQNCGDTCPVEQVSWNDAKEYIQKLNAKTGKQYRLPSEAEWEYACRAGGKQEYCGSDNVDSVAWYGSNSGSTTHAAAQKQANAFGLYDMSGNVWEWVADSYHDNYNGTPVDGSEWQGDGARRVLRGGSWYDEPQFARSAFRYFFGAANRDFSDGFRLARTLP